MMPMGILAVVAAAWLLTTLPTVVRRKRGSHLMDMSVSASVGSGGPWLTAGGIDGSCGMGCDKPPGPPMEEPGGGGAMLGTPGKCP